MRQRDSEPTYRETSPAPAIEVGIGLASVSHLYADLSGDVVGVFAASAGAWAADTPIDLVVAFPDGATFRARGAVVSASTRDETPGLFVRFVAIEPSDLAAARTFCKKYRPALFYEPD